MWCLCAASELNVKPVTHRGTVHLNDSLVLIDILCVPNFRFNLISLSKLNMQKSCTMISNIADCVTSFTLQMIFLLISSLALFLY